jgi:hypothetical protein
MKLSNMDVTTQSCKLHESYFTTLIAYSCHHRIPHVTNEVANRERTRVHASLDCISCLHLPPPNLTLVYTIPVINRHEHGRDADAQRS